MAFKVNPYTRKPLASKTTTNLRVIEKHIQRLYGTYRNQLN